MVCLFGSFVDSCGGYLFGLRLRWFTVGGSFIVVQLRVSWCLWMFVDCGFGLIGFVGFGFASWVLCSVGCWVCLFWCSFTWFGCFNVGGGFLFDFVGVLVCGVSMLVWGNLRYGAVGLLVLGVLV